MEDDSKPETERAQARLSDSESRIVALCLGNDAKSIGAFYAARQNEACRRPHSPDQTLRLLVRECRLRLYEWLVWRW